MPSAIEPTALPLPASQIEDWQLASAMLSGEERVGAGRAGRGMKLESPVVVYRIICPCSPVLPGVSDLARPTSVRNSLR